MAGPTAPVALPTQSDGQLIPYTDDDVAAFDVRRRGMRDGSHVRFNFGPDGSGCSRRFSCLWDQFPSCAIYFLGASNLYAVAGQYNVSRLVPVTDPLYSNWICTKVELEPFQFAGTINATGTIASQAYPEYSRADFTATFELVPYAVASDADTTNEINRYVTYPGNVGAEISTETNYIGLPGGSLNYATVSGTGVPAGVPIPYPIGFAESQQMFKVIWRRVPDILWSPTSAYTQMVIGSPSAIGYLGAVNQDYFLGYDPLSLQLRGCEVRRLPDPTGIGYSWDITFIISQKPVPYGQLGFYYRDIAGVPAGNPGTASGYYMVLAPAAGKTVLSPGSLASPDYQSLFQVREFANLFVPGPA